MKFSKKSRTTFEVQQYNPGPGYYIHNDKIDQQVANTQQNNFSSQCTFAKKERFNHIIDEETIKLGPGSYKIDKSDFDKFNKAKNIKRQKYEKSSDQSQYVRINAVPSIPSKNVKEGYQEIGEGLLIVMKNQKENDNVGPGQYTPNYNFVKPRAQKTFIPNEVKQKQALQETLQKLTKGNIQASQLSDGVTQNEIGQVGLSEIDLNINQLSKLNMSQKSILENIQSQTRPESELRIRQPQGQRFRSELTCLVSRDPRKTQIGEYNLELLMIRERQLAKDEKAPPPGKYFNQDIHSSFKVGFKPPEYQCFDSSSQRFEENCVFKNQLGPGSYNCSNQSAINGFTNQVNVKFGKQKRAVSVYDDLIKSNVPGPGVYDMKQHEIGNLEKYDLHKLKQANLKFNSVFGSGATRFNDQRPQTDSLLGPGTYNIKDDSKFKKRRRVRTVYMQNNSEETLIATQNNKMSTSKKLIANNTSVNKDLLSQGDRVKLNYSQGMLLNNISNIDQNTTNYTKIIEINDISFGDVKKPENNYQYQSNQQNTYQFKSQTNRFNQNNQSFDTKHNIDGSDKLGPGCYEITQDLQKQSHNKGSDLMSKSPRNTNRIEGIQIPKLGPGYYDPSVQVVKPKQTCLTKL